MAGKESSQKLGKLVETGLSVAKIAQAKAEEALRDVAHISEAQRNQMRELFEETAKKSRENTEALIKGLRKEMEKQIRAANAISKEEFAKFSERLSSLSQDLGKMSSLREEIAKLTDALNSLIRSMQKPESASEKVETDEASLSGNGAGGPAAVEEQKPSTRAKSTAKSKSGSTRARSSSAGSTKGSAAKPQEESKGEGEGE